MPALYVVDALPPSCRFDAAMPQAGAISEKSCQFGQLWAILHSGRTQAALTSRRGPVSCEALQEDRSRGCRAPRLPFWPCAWLLSWQPAVASKLMKSFTWTSRRPSPPSRPSPVSTSKTIGRVFGAQSPRPALFLSAVCAADSAEFPAPTAHPIAPAQGGAYAGPVPNDSIRRFPCGPLPFLPCWPLLLSQPVPSPRPNQSRPQCRLSRKAPASTNKIPDRARRGCPVAPVNLRRAPQQEVRPC